MSKLQERKNAKDWIKLFQSHENYILWRTNIPYANYVELLRYNELTWSDFINYSFTWSSTPEGVEFWSRFAMGKPEVDPETGKISSTVTYLPKFKEMRIDLIKKRNEVKPFKFSANEDIAKVAKNINTNLTKVSQMIFALEKMIELQNKSK